MRKSWSTPIRMGEARARRLSELDVDYKVFPAPGTSEDIAAAFGLRVGSAADCGGRLHSNLLTFGKRQAGYGFDVFDQG